MPNRNQRGYAMVALLVGMSIMAIMMTVVMPVWNPRGDWLMAAVRSVLGQCACRLELIVVDDGCASPVEEQLRDEGTEQPEPFDDFEAVKDDLAVEERYPGADRLSSDE